jgi:hypothetical protein
MLVRTLVGRMAGQLVDMPYAVAQSNIAAGTAALPDAIPRVKGLKIAPTPLAAAAPKPAAPKRKTRRKAARRVKPKAPAALG